MAASDYSRKVSRDITKSLMQQYFNNVQKEQNSTYQYGKISADGNSATLPDGTTMDILNRGRPGQYSLIYKTGAGQGMADVEEQVFITADSNKKSWLIANKIFKADNTIDIQLTDIRTGLSAILINLPRDYDFNFDLNTGRLGLYHLTYIYQYNANVFPLTSSDFTVPTYGGNISCSDYFYCAASPIPYTYDSSIYDDIKQIVYGEGYIFDNLKVSQNNTISFTASSYFNLPIADISTINCPYQDLLYVPSDIYSNYDYLYNPAIPENLPEIVCFYTKGGIPFLKSVIKNSVALPAGGVVIQGIYPTVTFPAFALPTGGLGCPSVTYPAAHTYTVVPPSYITVTQPLTPQVSIRVCDIRLDTSNTQSNTNYYHNSLPSIPNQFWLQYIISTASPSINSLTLAYPEVSPSIHSNPNIFNNNYLYSSIIPNFLIDGSGNLYFLQSRGFDYEYNPPSQGWNWAIFSEYLDVYSDIQSITIGGDTLNDRLSIMRTQAPLSISSVNNTITPLFFEDFKLGVSNIPDTTTYGFKVLKDNTQIIILSDNSLILPDGTSGTYVGLYKFNSQSLKFEEFKWYGFPSLILRTPKSADIFIG